MPAWVMTMKVPPTSSAATITAARSCRSAATAMPSAIAACAPRQIRSRVPARQLRHHQAGQRGGQSEQGQAQPNTAGSGMTSLAMAGRKVAGMM